MAHYVSPDALVACMNFNSRMHHCFTVVSITDSTLIPAQIKHWEVVEDSSLVFGQHWPHATVARHVGRAVEKLRPDIVSRAWGCGQTMCACARELVQCPTFPPQLACLSFSLCLAAADYM